MEKKIIGYKEKEVGVHMPIYEGDEKPLSEKKWQHEIDFFHGTSKFEYHGEDVAQAVENCLRRSHVSEEVRVVPVSVIEEEFGDLK